MVNLRVGCAASEDVPNQQHMAAVAGLCLALRCSVCCERVGVEVLITYCLDGVSPLFCVSEFASSYASRGPLPAILWLCPEP